MAKFNYCYFSEKIDGKKECRHAGNVGGSCDADFCPIMWDEKYNPGDAYDHFGNTFIIECE